VNRMRFLVGLLSFVSAGSLLPAVAIAGDVAASAVEIRPLLVGSQVPEAQVRTVDGAAVGLRETIGDRPAVLVFYRGGWCPFCTRDLQELRHTVEPLRQLGVQLIAISGDSSERLRSTMDDTEVPFTLLADFELEASKAFGLAFHVSDEYVQMLAEYKKDTRGNSVSSEQVLPVPAVFVVSSDKTITFSYVNPNYKVRCDKDVLLAAAAAVTRKPGS